MSLNDTPSANRVHIGFFGKMNAGKSSVVNAVTAQSLAIVSSAEGTTTDPVYKAMELLPLGPVMIIDTPGFNDTGVLGELRVKKTKQVLAKIDIAVLIIAADEEPAECERELAELFKQKNIPFITVLNKCDLIKDRRPLNENEIYTSALTGEGIYELKEKIARTVKPDGDRRIIGDLLKPGDTAVLVVPIDKAAPKGRLILPQQQTIRDILDANAAAYVVKENGLKTLLDSMTEPPAVIITDSQVFQSVANTVPEDIPLTSFSILMARYKGFLNTALKGTQAVDALRDGDKVLIAEGCTHHRQCGDIGTVKIPAWIRQYTKKDISFKAVSGTEFPEDLSEYKLVIHCGGCMLREREIAARLQAAVSAGVPVTNYGTLIAKMKGILPRSIRLLKNEIYGK